MNPEIQHHPHHPQSQPQPRRNATQIQDIVHRYRQSQMAQAAFARLEGICVATLRKYNKRYANGDGEESGRFIEVERADFSASAGRLATYRVCFQGGLTLEIPSGFSLREATGLLEALSAMGRR